MVVIVAFEKLLSRGLAQRDVVCFELLVLEVPPLFIDVFLVEVVFLWGHEGSPDLSVAQVVPREVTQPGVLLNFLSVARAESVLRFALDHLQSIKKA